MKLLERKKKTVFHSYLLRTVLHTLQEGYELQNMLGIYHPDSLRTTLLSLQKDYGFKNVFNCG